MDQYKVAKAATEQAQLRELANAIGAEVEYLKLVGVMRRLIGARVTVYAGKLTVDGSIHKVTGEALVVKESKRVDFRCETTHTVGMEYVRAVAIEIGDDYHIKVLVHLK